jgi:hypothetical protein
MSFRWRSVSIFANAREASPFGKMSVSSSPTMMKGRFTHFLRLLAAFFGETEIDPRGASQSGATDGHDEKVFLQMPDLRLDQREGQLEQLAELVTSAHALDEERLEHAVAHEVRADLRFFEGLGAFRKPAFHHLPF